VINEQSGEYCDIGSRKIYHFHFQKWPDKSVPSDPGPLLEYMQEVSRVSKTFDGQLPVVVHCR